jgi:hypothetical protein
VRQLGGRLRGLVGDLSGYVFPLHTQGPVPLANHYDSLGLSLINLQKVLLSFLVAAVVAASEITLYIIWESRRHAKSRSKPHRLVAGHKKDDDNQGMEKSPIVPMHDETQQYADGLRQRFTLTEESILVA